MVQREFAGEAARGQLYLDGDRATVSKLDARIRNELRIRYPRLRGEHDDLVQTVHAALVTNLRHGRFEARSTLETYATGILHRVAILRLRALYRERALTDPAPADVPAAGANPYRAMVVADERRLLHQALLGLPPMCRELWRLVFLERLDYRAVAQRLAVPEGTVKSRMWHCRRRMAAAFARLCRLRP